MGEKKKIGKLKAIDVNIESLKLYITLSTILIGGLLAYNSSIGHGFSFWLFASLTLFLICAIGSIISINCYIYKLDRGEIDVKAKDARIFNIISILCFLLGLISTFIFFFSIRNLDLKSTPEPDIIINQDKITIKGKLNSNIQIGNDSLGRTIIFKQNNN